MRPDHDMIMMTMMRRNKFDDDHDHKQNEEDDHDNDHELLKFHVPLKTREFDSLHKSDQSAWAAKGGRWRVGGPQDWIMDSWRFFVCISKTSCKQQWMILLLVRYSHPWRLDSFPTMDFLFEIHMEVF